ncbi:dual specificity testis-specific protein kinase 2-like [Patiria miniata]|uniref:dual-specificity kinase n=1 Tax=Patiria miniata TaxID=46514 RepID=A0A914AVF3_PATMI|nr:dual specificity testis-specific protein kinase 2-like [Patiria miniata]
MLGFTRQVDTMSQRERHVPPNSIPLKVNTSGYQPQQGTSPSRGNPNSGRSGQNGKRGVEWNCGNVADSGSLPLNDASSSSSPPTDHHPVRCIHCDHTSTSPDRNHSFPSTRSDLVRHDTVGYTHCDGHGQVWCDGRNQTHSRTPADSLRPLSPGSSAVDMKTLLDNVARVDDFDREEIGSGFFSTVYKVRHKKTGQVLVLKLNNKESSFASVIQEIQLLKKLQHPNIIKLLGVCVHEANIHALIEYMNGGTLSSVLLDESLHLSWMTRIALAKDIASGMSYFHMHSVIHRDLTSMNCLIKKASNGSMHAVVADLGLAARIPRDQSEKLQTVGTPFWTSPENLTGKFYTEKTDLFSFGIILCEIIARVTANPDELPRLHNFGLDMEAFRMLSGNCPEQLLLVAFSCCNMEPGKRPAFTEVVLSIRNIEADFTRQSKRLPSLSGRLRSQSTVVVPYQLHTVPDARPALIRSPRNSVVRSNSDSGSRPRKVNVSKKWVNPFDTPHLKNGQTKLIEQTSSIVLSELPAEIRVPLQEMLQEDEDEEAEIAKEAAERCMRQRSKSLPSSPVIHRLELKVDENINVIHSSSDISDGMSVADRRKTLSPGFVASEWLEGRRAGRARSKTTSDVTYLKSDPGLGALSEDKLGLGSRDRKIIESSEDA